MDPLATLSDDIDLSGGLRLASQSSRARQDYHRLVDALRLVEGVCIRGELDVDQRTLVVARTALRGSVAAARATMATCDYCRDRGVAEPPLATCRVSSARHGYLGSSCDRCSQDGALASSGSIEPLA